MKKKPVLRVLMLSFPDKTSIGKIFLPNSSSRLSYLLPLCTLLPVTTHSLSFNSRCPRRSTNRATLVSAQCLTSPTQSPTYQNLSRIQSIRHSVHSGCPVAVAPSVRDALKVASSALAVYWTLRTRFRSRVSSLITSARSRKRSSPIRAV